MNKRPGITVTDAARDITTVLVHSFNSCSCRAYWQEGAVNFVTSLDVLCQLRGRKYETEKLHYYNSLLKTLDLPVIITSLLHSAR